MGIEIPDKLAIDDWSAEGIYVSLGTGGMGIFALCVTSLDRLQLDVVQAGLIALAPCIIFALMSVEHFPVRFVRAAQWFSIGLYGLLSAAALYLALDQGMAQVDVIFIGFMCVGLVTCLVAALELRGIETPNPTVGMFSDETEQISRDVFEILGTLVFVAAGIGMLFGIIEGPRWLAWTSIVFFGVCASVLTYELARTIKRESGGKTFEVKCSLEKITVTCNDETREVEWSSVDQVRIRIDNAYLPQPWWEISGLAASCTFPSDAIGWQEAQDQIARRLAFTDDNHIAVVKAMGMEAGNFKIWERSQAPSATHQ